MRRGGIAALAAAIVLLGAAAPSLADQGDGDIVPPSKTGTYLVVLDDAPAISYEGGVPGLAATAPAEGAKLDQHAPAVQAYVDHLDSVQDETLAAVGADPGAKLADYTFALNGFAAELNDAQAAALKGLSGVRLVVPDQVYQVQREVDAYDTAVVDHKDGKGNGGYRGGYPGWWWAPGRHNFLPWWWWQPSYGYHQGQGGDRSETVNDFLGLTDKNGAYANGITGEDVVVGIIDTGIWPEHPSFADDGSYGPLPEGSFTGTGCDFGNTDYNADDAPFTCNNKLLAAKSYGSVIHGGTGEGLEEGSFLSARDEDGHGTHTASTAAGNASVEAEIFGRDYGEVSGIAPRARLSVYKACWSPGCSVGDLADAIDSAIGDGVDVINYSIGSDTPDISLDSLYFLLANQAGVFVSVSAGNAGSDAGTVGSPAVVPWVTSVGASTQPVAYTGTVKLGNKKSYSGYTVTDGLPSAPLVDARTLGNPLCLNDVPFNASVAGKIVLCERGPNRILKSVAVRDAGGVGMILFNVEPLDEMTDNHVIPSIHVTEQVGEAIRHYIAKSGKKATASLTGGRTTVEKGDEMTYFSSRGPNLYTPDIISPDVTAPGLRILAGNSPAALLGAQGELFQSIAGTSMSSPHVAGIYALLKQAHPEWTPAEAKSALMTTARQDVSDPSSGSRRADPFDFGAGHVDPGGRITKPGSLFNPGLVYDTGVWDYLAYLCEPSPEVPEVYFGYTCDDLASAGYATAAEDLNLASIGISDVTGSATVTRTVTNVTGSRSYWYAVTTAPKGFKVQVSPSSLLLDPGEQATFSVTVTRTKAAFDTWSFGSLTWFGWGGFEVRSPIAVQAKYLAAPDETVGSGPEGTGELSVGFGYTGDYQAVASGLVAATQTPGTVVDDPADDINAALASGVGVTTHQVTVPDGTAISRFALYDDTVGHPGNDDLDLYVFGPDGDLVGASGTASSDEEVTLLQPAAGVYRVVVHGWNASTGSTTYVLNDWSVPLDDGDGTLTITSAPTASAGTVGTVGYAWTGATEPGGHYLGAIVHNSPEGLQAITAVSITG